MRNVISGNRFFQVLVDSSSGDFHSIQGNYIGLNAAGNARIFGGPKVTGIHVVQTTNSIIGGNGEGI